MVEQHADLYLSADISIPFDSVGIEAVSRAMQFRQVPIDILAATLREMTRLEGSAFLAGVHSEQFPFRRLRQGGSETTTLFNLVVRAVFSETKAAWGERGVQVSFLG